MTRKVFKSRPSPRWRLRLLALLAAGALSVGGWAGGFVWFIADVQRPGPLYVEPADAVVVFTGGADRLAAGLALLREGRAPQLLISGVGGGVTLAALLQANALDHPDVACCITLGYRAQDTVGNAAEAAAFARRIGAERIILVTSSYHMQRGTLELARLSPTLSVVPYPVEPRLVRAWRAGHWQAGGLWLLFAEYNKLLIAWGRDALLRAAPPLTNREA